MAEADPKLMTDLAELVIKDKLRDLAMRYCRGIDRRDMELIRSVYHPGAIDEHGDVFVGAIEEFIAWQPSVMAPFDMSAHNITNTSYRIDGDKADGELYFFGYTRSYPPNEKHEFVTGRYLDNYECRNGEWLIARRRLVWDSYITFDAQQSDMDVLRSLGVIGGKADDLSYDSLPLMGRGK